MYFVTVPSCVNTVNIPLKSRGAINDSTLELQRREIRCNLECMCEDRSLSEWDEQYSETEVVAV